MSNHLKLNVNIKVVRLQSFKILHSSHILVIIFQTLLLAHVLSSQMCVLTISLVLCWIHTLETGRVHSYRRARCGAVGVSGKT